MPAFVGLGAREPFCTPRGVVGDHGCASKTACELINRARLTPIRGAPIVTERGGWRGDPHNLWEVLHTFQFNFLTCHANVRDQKPAANNRPRKTFRLAETVAYLVAEAHTTYDSNESAAVEAKDRILSRLKAGPMSDRSPSCTCENEMLGHYGRTIHREKSLGVDWICPIGIGLRQKTAARNQRSR